MMTHEPSAVATLRTALESLGADRATKRRKAATETIPTLCSALRDMASWGGTPNSTPAELIELADAAEKMASLVALTDAKKYPDLIAGVPWAVATLRCADALNALADAAVRGGQPATLDALRALQDNLGDRVEVPHARR